METQKGSRFIGVKPNAHHPLPEFEVSNNPTLKAISLAQLGVLYWQSSLACA